MQGACISDTLLQVLLTTQSLEEALTEILLEKFVELCNEGNESLTVDQSVETPLHQQPLPQLLLAQLQVLDNGNCSEKVSNLMIEAFESLPPPMQAQICTIVGEAVPAEKVEGPKLMDYFICSHACDVWSHSCSCLIVWHQLPERMPNGSVQSIDPQDSVMRLPCIATLTCHVLRFWHSTSRKGLR